MATNYGRRNRNGMGRLHLRHGFRQYQGRFTLHKSLSEIYSKPLFGLMGGQAWEWQGIVASRWCLADL